MALILDAGALIAAEKRDRRVRARLTVAWEERLPVQTGSTVLAPVWLGGSRQASLARALTSDPDDLRRLLAARGVGVRVVSI